MSALHVVVQPSAASPSPALAPLHGLLDVNVDGDKLGARIGDAAAFAVLGEIGHAVAALISGRRDRATVQLYAEEQVWELGLEADAEDVLASVFRSGRAPDVAVFERRLSLAAFSESIASALDEAHVSRAPRGIVANLLLARTALGRLRPCYGRAPVDRVATEIAPRALRGFGISARTQVRRCRPNARGAADPQLERADLHSLLVAGELTVTARGHVTRVDGVQLFLLAERLLLLADDVLEATLHGRPLFRRVEAGGVRLAARRGPHEVSLAFGVAPADGARPGVTFPEIEPAVFAGTVARFARQLAEAVARHDPSQLRNLRLTQLLRSAAAIEERVDDGDADDSLTNPEPESYRSYGLPRKASDTRGFWDKGGSMRFMPRWVAAVPGLDLRATYLCGERLIVGSNREVACLHRQSGTVLWRFAASRAASVVTPSGLARLLSDGTLNLHDLESGDVRFSTHVTPRSGRGVAGAVVHAPGLPKLLVLAEGERSVTAVDLVGGDVRWRHTARRAANYRLRRAGKLLLAAGGDSALLALDVVTGEVVWRVRDRVPFSGEMCVERDATFALAGGPIGPAKLHHVDLWSGKIRWTRELEERPVPGQAPIVAGNVVMVVTRDRRGSGVSAFDRDTGAPAWEHAPGFTSPTAAWLGVDDGLIANSAAGTLQCIDAQTGGVRYSQVFPRHVESDQPRRLEPVLRNGALFVPQHQVHVVRPRDGELLGTVPTDLIPDLVRVDERCEVYVAEESGHVAAFGAAPKLVLVKN